MLRTRNTIPLINLAKRFCTTTAQTEPQERKVEIHRNGDDGYSNLLSGRRLPKNHKIFTAIGCSEELNSHIGMARIFAKEGNHPYGDNLKRIQTVLIDIVEVISREKSSDKHRALFDEHIKELEEWMEIYGRNIHPYERYIVPGGSLSASSLQIARSACRRMEREFLELRKEVPLDDEITIFINRLADFLLILSRIATTLDQATESIYIPKPEL